MKLLKKQILHEMQEFKEQECSTKPADVPEIKKSTLQFMPGIIIKVKLNEPVKNPPEIKVYTLTFYSYVLYLQTFWCMPHGFCSKKLLSKLRCVCVRHE